MEDWPPPFDQEVTDALERSEAVTRWMMNGWVDENCFPTTEEDWIRTLEAYHASHNDTWTEAYTMLCVAEHVGWTYVLIYPPNGDNKPRKATRHFLPDVSCPEEFSSSPVRLGPTISVSISGGGELHLTEYYETARAVDLSTLM